MQIRFAKEEDEDQVLNLLDELIAETNKKNPNQNKSGGDNRVRGNFFEEELEREDIKIFVAEDKRKLIAMAEFFIVPILRRGYYHGVIETFVVSEKERGKGVGGTLIEEIFKFAKNQNIKVVKLTSGLQLTDAHQFYEKHGGKFAERMYRFEL